ncbi:MAG: hypothetical protein IJY99_00960 [Alphaproteobacteria bacterium]|nr:hypothetical protein [Alphaproteobacteria bacterium]
MKKLTAGILTVMLGIVSANSADAAVASKSYVDQIAKSKADAAQSAAEATAAGALAGAKSELEGKIDAKVAQSDYNTKIGQLEQADTDISDLVGTLPEGTTATTIVGYIDKKTEGIASQGAMTQLSNQVSTLSDKVDTNTGAIETLNGTGDGSVAKQIADSITALNLETTYASKTTVETAYQNAINTAEQAAKNYADGLAGNYDAKGDAASALADAKAYADGLAVNYATADQGALAASALQKADITVGATNGTISVDGTDVAVTGLGSAAFTESTAYDATGSAAQALADAKDYTDDEIVELGLQPISKVPASCANEANYCVLTTNGSTFVWEVVARADGEVGGSAADVTE